ncbi:hypothetical protein J6590_096775 [Homalodisca vitripennis]|nr:hypothetical protein J6590_096775 [Homalodisca vitripennis]
MSEEFSLRSSEIDRERTPVCGDNDNESEGSFFTTPVSDSDEPSSEDEHEQRDKSVAFSEHSYALQSQYGGGDAFNMELEIPSQDILVELGNMPFDVAVPSTSGTNVTNHNVNEDTSFLAPAIATPGDKTKSSKKRNELDPSWGLQKAPTQERPTFHIDLADDREPIDYYNEFVPKNVIELMVNKTNRNAEQIQSTRRLS